MNRYLMTTLAVGLLVAGCGRKDAPAPEAGPPSPVSVADAAAASYLTENTASGEMRLVNGHYTDSDLVTADLDEQTATGDLDGDGVADRAVIITTSTGGSGIFEDLYVLRREKDAGLVISAPATLGDRVEINGLRIENGEVVVDLVVQSPDDPLCCPTRQATYRFRLSGNALEETTGLRRTYLKE